MESIEHTLHCHEELITASASHLSQATDAQTKALAALADQLQRLELPGPPPAPSSPHAAAFTIAPLLAPDTPEPRVGKPKSCGGEPEICGPFNMNCTLIFALQPRTFTTELAKVTLTINHLTGRAWLWGTAEWER